MTEQTKMLSPPDESTTTKSSDSKSNESSEDEAGNGRSAKAVNKRNVNLNDTNKVATDAPDETADQADEYGNQIGTRDLENDNKFSPVPEHSEMENSTTASEERNNIKKSPKATPKNLSSGSKAKPRRRSNGIPEHRAKKLNKKTSKARMTHIDAKPGDYFYVRLKGYPLWPAIVCDETMLPSSLIKSRPVTAARADGTYREDFMDGAPKAKDRSFPVMYLFTNEFGWIPNYDLLEIDFDEVANITGSMRKDLAMARQLAAEKHDLDYFKDILKSFMEATEIERLEQEREEEDKVIPKEKKDNSEKKKTPRKQKKAKAIVTKDEDIDMPNSIAKMASEDQDSNYLAVSVKRPAEEPLESPPKKRTTIKLTTKTKTEVLDQKNTKASGSKKTKSEKPEKIVKARKVKVSSIPAAAPPLEPELSIEEKRVKREKEILFLRHKLQKGLLAKDQELKAEDMKLMSEFIEKLEAYNDLEISIIRQTKINKVLKAILKIPKIPLEHEFRFKLRSQSLLEQWNKLYPVESGDPALSTSNGANTEVRHKSEVDNPKK